MAKNTKTSKANAPGSIKKLARTKRTLNTRDLKKVRGGDFNNDGFVDGLDLIKKKPINLGK